MRLKWRVKKGYVEKRVRIEGSGLRSGVGGSAVLINQGEAIGDM